MEFTGISIKGLIPAQLQGELRLYPGKTFFAKVISSSGDKVLLEMMGRRLQAESSADFSEGQKLLLRVGEISDNKIYLNTVSDPENETFQKISQDFAAVGITENKTNQSLMQEILKSEVIVTSKDFAALAETAEKMQLAEKQLPALVWLWRNNLPLTEETVRLVFASQTMRLASGNEFQDLLNILSQKDSDQLQQMQAVLKETVLKPEKNVNEILHTLSNLSKNLGLGYELNLLKDQGQENSLKALLFDLEQSFSGEEKQLVGQLLGRLTHLQLMLRALENPPAVVLETFIEWQGKRSPVYIKIKEGETAGGNSEKNANYAVYLFLDTPKLGQVAAKIRLAGKELAVVLEVEKTAVQRMLQQRIHRLQNNLEKLPYHLRSLTATLKEPSALRREWQTAFAMPEPGSVDFRV